MESKEERLTRIKEKLNSDTMMFKSKTRVEASSYGLCGLCGEDREKSHYTDAVSIHDVWGPPEMLGQSHNEMIYICEPCHIEKLEHEIQWKKNSIPNTLKQIERLEKELEGLTK